MEPFPITTARLLLDQPTDADVDDITRYCADPLFERFLTTPWPYRRGDAEGFVGSFVPGGWTRNDEWTWAIRDASAARKPLLGVIAVRLTSGMVGFWLGAPHRGHGLLPEALDAVIDAVWERSDLDAVLWECVIGNVASMRVAQKCNFRFTGTQEGLIPARDGSRVLAWTGRRSRFELRAASEHPWPAPPDATAPWPVAPVE